MANSEIAAKGGVNLVRFTGENVNGVRLGIREVGGAISDITHTIADEIHGSPAGTLDSRQASELLVRLIGSPRDVKERVFNQINAIETESLGTFAQADTRLLAPIVPGNIYCIGLNYDAHKKEFLRNHRPVDRSPRAGTELIVFAKSTNSVIGHDEEIAIPTEITRSVDYEAELGVVIGERGTNIPVERAWNYVFGLTAVNDVTARDVQARQQQWFLSKSYDTFCPIGPSIYTEGGAAHPPSSLKIESFVNGDKRQEGTIGEMIRDVPRLISELSESHTLNPGDVIATGTPEGVGLGFDTPRYLKAGDVIEVSIDNIGVLRNSCVEV